MHITHFYNHPAANANTLGLGLQTAYHDIGSKSGEVFVLVHGFTGSKLDFQDQIPWFGDDYRVIALDQRGHGESSNIGPYSLDTAAADLITFLDGLAIEKCHILGHSLGGMVVLRALLTHAEHFASAILMDTTSHGLTMYPEKIRTQINQMVLDQGCEGMIGGMQGQPQSRPAQRGIDFLGEAEHWRRIRVKLEQMDPAAFVELGLEIAQQTSVTDKLSEISMPTSIIVGSKDKPFVEPAKVMHKHLPNSQLLKIDKAGHCPQYENADAWRAAIESHFQFAAAQTC